MTRGTQRDNFKNFEKLAKLTQGVRRLSSPHWTLLRRRDRFDGTGVDHQAQDIACRLDRRRRRASPQQISQITSPRRNPSSPPRCLSANAGTVKLEHSPCRSEGALRDEESRILEVESRSAQGLFLRFYHKDHGEKPQNICGLRAPW
jgi:hypothetical protein